MTALLWPNLGYKDARAAMRFLISAFGFEEVVVYEGETPGTIGHAVLGGPAVAWSRYIAPNRAAPRLPISPRRPPMADIQPTPSMSRPTSPTPCSRVPSRPGPRSSGRSRTPPCGRGGSSSATRRACSGASALRSRGWCETPRGSGGPPPNRDPRWGLREENHERAREAATERSAQGVLP